MIDRKVRQDEKKTDTGTEVQEKNGRRGEDRRNEDEDEEKKFCRDEIIKYEEKVMVKLVKLKITKFEGTALDWFRFWNQFETEIGQVQISPISKLSYLKEYLVPKVRLLIDGVPFTFEGYARAKSVF